MVVRFRVSSANRYTIRPYEQYTQLNAKPFTKRQFIWHVINRITYYFFLFSTGFKTWNEHISDSSTFIIPNESSLVLSVVFNSSLVPSVVTSSIVKFPAVIGSREECHQLTFSKELVTVLNDLKTTLETSVNCLPGELDRLNPNQTFLNTTELYQLLENHTQNDWGHFWENYTQNE